MTDVSPRELAARARGRRHDDGRLSRRGILLAILITGYIGLAALLTPTGVTSGQYPDFLIYTAGGAVFVQPLLFAMWGGLGPGPALRRIVITASLCILLAAADAVGASRRPRVWEDRPFDGFAFALTLFALFTFALLWLRRSAGWEIVHRHAVSVHRGLPRFRFGLRLMLLWVTLAACLLALYQTRCPDGAAMEFAASLWRRLVRRLVSHTPVLVLLFLPVLFVPWATLTWRGAGKRAALAAGSAWAVYDAGLVWMLTQVGFGPLVENVQVVLCMQIGGAAAALLGAVVVRAGGYRIVRSKRAVVERP